MVVVVVVVVLVGGKEDDEVGAVVVLSFFFSYPFLRGANGICVAAECLLNVVLVLGAGGSNVVIGAPTYAALACKRIFKDGGLAFREILR